MTKKECLEILYTMACGASFTEKEAIQYVEKTFKKAKEAKRWKRKYLNLKRKLDNTEMECIYYTNDCQRFDCSECELNNNK